MAYKPLRTPEEKRTKDNQSKSRWYFRNKDKAKIVQARFWAKNPGKMCEYAKQYRQRIRLQALNHYSVGKLVCGCCGIQDWRFLCIDHMNNDGNAHRRGLKTGARPSSTTMFIWLKKNGYPAGFQVLCFNCNAAKSCYGQCPHVEKANG